MTEESNDLPNHHRISEENAHRLLARAAELDAQRGGELSVAQLREIALEAGIEGAAFDEALSEFAMRGDGHSIGDRVGANPRAVGRTARVVGWLTRHRALAVFGTMLAVAFATPGDLVFLTFAISAPTYAVYELCRMIARQRNRPTEARPSAPTSRTPDARILRPPSGSIDQMVRALLLHHA